MTNDERLDRVRGSTGVFGGTFDPIHLAHLAVAEAARDSCGLRRVLFVPAAQPPHKPDRVIAPVEHRLAMVEAAVATNATFEVSRIEIERDGPSYTVDTLTTLRDAEPDDRLALILSEESFAELPTWREPERIMELVEAVIVAPRGGFGGGGGSTLASPVDDASPDRLRMLDGPHIRLSASEIRERAASGRSIRYLVPDAVAAYIGDHGLYQDHRRDHRT